MDDIADMYLDGRAKVSSYRAMLESLLETGLPALTHLEVMVAREGAQRFLCLRHDVDHDVEKALRMARIEHALGMRASYYLLPPGDYDKRENYYGTIAESRIVHSPRMRDIAQEIVGLGHEIGLHNDFLQLSVVLGRPLRELIAEQIAEFRSAGIEIKGSASHGSRFARACGYVNYEIFAECFRPKSVRRAIELPGGKSFDLYSVSMAELGLEYEAYDLKRDCYISDTGSRILVRDAQFETVQPTMFADLVGSSERVVALFHPEWWRVTGAGAAARPDADRAASIAVPAASAAAAVRRQGAENPLFIRPDGKPFRIGVRGDCCSRRAVVMNKALFPRGVELIINEKCPNSCFVDTLSGHGASLEQGEALCDVASMPPTLKHYYVGQFDRSVLDARDLDLLMFDSYSDMNFELWRHRVHGWSLWVHPKYLRAPDDLRSVFEKVRQASLDEAAQAICTVIDHVRKANPGLPVLILHQPFEHYPKLEKRSEFHHLGERVAAQRTGVFFAAALPRQELVPADVGSCGPGLTLHFDAATYLKMLEDAWRRGLGAMLTASAADRAALVAAKPSTPASDAPAPAVQPPSTPSPVQAQQPASLSTASTANIEGAVQISYGQGRAECRPSCGAAVEAAVKTFAQYFRHPQIDGDAAPEPRYTPMLIDVDEVRDFAAWEARIKKFGNGARLRQKRKAASMDYYVKLFGWRQHVPDVHDVNHSKSVRSGGVMRGSYLRSVEEMGGAPDRPYAPVMPACPHHWALTFGVFLKEPGHMQGSVRVDERLVAYLSLRRCGDVALYSQILGHGDHLTHGILVLLHHEVVRWVSEHLNGPARGLRFLMYGGRQNGGESLYQFKRQSGFTAHPVLAFPGPLPSSGPDAGATSRQSGDRAVAASDRVN